MTQRHIAGTKYAGLFVTENADTGVTHGNQCLRDAVESKPLLRLAPDVVGGAGTG